MTTVRRFHVLPQYITDTVQIVDQQVQHMRNVLRLSAGDTVEVFDGLGNCYDVELTRISKKKIEGTVLRHKKEKSPVPRITLAQGIPRSQKMDLIIQKVTELGVYAISPLLTDRTVFTTDSVSLVKKKPVGRRSLVRRLNSVEDHLSLRLPILLPLMLFVNLSTDHP